MNAYLLAVAMAFPGYNVRYGNAGGATRLGTAADAQVFMDRTIDAQGNIVIVPRRYPGPTTIPVRPPLPDFDKPPAMTPLGGFSRRVK
ncbi:MAG: hypothetical protein ACPGPS_04000 [Rubripirellula sp.]